ncbi:DUF5924 family protein [Vreelandella malpeensis]|uniref:DUF2914 domain-containing protein n=1 Tax=Vreelandella malpeensis TaxID=1172368 RepID=A0ABS8DV55_9GAMM|nr:DUF5924 family protein [Halomonas malpeensis]MCB8890138.1 DUF2914 domain-containing protein [Halomonas malpeensis]
MGAFLTPARAAALRTRAERIVAFVKPWTFLWPPVAFAAGLGSFFLVDRQQWLGAALALGLLLAWALMLCEGLLSRLLRRRGQEGLPRAVTTFIAQMIHQETLFFTLPFILITTVWNSGQLVFAALVVFMAVFSIIDPLYYKLAGRSRSLYFLFHAQCVFLVLLVILPIMVHLDTGHTLLLALGLTVLIALPSFWNLVKKRSLSRWCLFLALLLGVAFAGWVGRVWVPPATLWMTGSALSPGFDTTQRTPQGEMALTPATLEANGVYVYTAIRAPRGLSETIYHAWHHNGQEMDTVTLDISGGREQGYRAWSHKLNFPEDPRGNWRVDIMTAGGQRLGLIRFTVADEEDEATLADGRIRASGLSRLNLGRFIPGREPGAESDTP